jgi:ribosomal protein S6--L-glutamate ligase
MILSYHPIIEAHRNIICAGREPNAQDLAAIRQADAVILHQGCYPSLYRMVRGNSPHWFPNMDVRFDFPGKCGQARLFERLDLPRPPTSCYATVEAYRRSPWPGPFPAVVKLDWGGEGDTVYKVTSTAGLAEALGVVERFEASGHFGFLVQQYIPSSHRVVRVAVVGTQLFSYWRIQPEGAPFGTAVSKGARIDAAADPPLQAAAERRCAGFATRPAFNWPGSIAVRRKRPGSRACPAPGAGNQPFFRTQGAGRIRCLLPNSGRGGGSLAVPVGTRTSFPMTRAVGMVRSPSAPGNPQGLLFIHNSLNSIPLVKATVGIETSDEFVLMSQFSPYAYDLDDRQIAAERRKAVN